MQNSRLYKLEEKVAGRRLGVGVFNFLAITTACVIILGLIFSILFTTLGYATEVEKSSYSITLLTTHADTENSIGWDGIPLFAKDQYMGGGAELTYSINNRFEAGVGIQTFNPRLDHRYYSGAGAGFAKGSMRSPMNKIYGCGRLMATDNIYFKLMGGVIQTSNLRANDFEFLYGAGIGCLFPINHYVTVLAEAVREGTSVDRPKLDTTSISLGLRWNL